MSNDTGEKAMHSMHRAMGCALIVLGGALAGIAHAAGTLASVTGDVAMTGPSGTKVQATQGATIPTGTLIATGDGAQAVIKFDDGGAVVLDHNTQFRVVDYRYDPAKPADGRSVFDILSGSARIVTGMIARTDGANYSLRTPIATMAVSNADFDLASGSRYISVNKGTLDATNAGGTTAFGAGHAGHVANAETLPQAVPAAQLPDAVGETFARLNGVALPEGTLLSESEGGAAGGAGGATGKAKGGFSGTTNAAILLGVGVVIAVTGMRSSK